MKKLCLIPLLLLFLTCDLFISEDDDSTTIDETDYSYYYPAEVVDYCQAPGFYSNYSSFSIKDNQENILDFPEGYGNYSANNTSIITLGEAGGYVTVKFDTAITNNSIDNGYDFIVYSNVFLENGTDEPQIEPAFIEVSVDGDTWYLLVSDNSLTAITKKTITYNNSDYTENSSWPEDCTEDSITLTTWESTNYSNGSGYCEITPTLENEADEDQVTFYANTNIQGGGDPFDISWAVDTDFNRLEVELEEISYIRITTGVYTDSSLASEYTATSTEIDSIIRINSEEE